MWPAYPLPRLDQKVISKGWVSMTTSSAPPFIALPRPTPNRKSTTDPINIHQLIPASKYLRCYLYMGAKSSQVNLQLPFVEFCFRLLFPQLFWPAKSKKVGMFSSRWTIREIWKNANFSNSMKRDFFLFAQRRDNEVLGTLTLQKNVPEAPKQPSKMRRFSGLDVEWQAYPNYNNNNKRKILVDFKLQLTCEFPKTFGFCFNITRSFSRKLP